MDISNITSFFSEIAPLLNTGNFLIIFYLLILGKDVKYRFNNLEQEQKDILTRVLINEKDIKKISEDISKHYMLSKEEALKYLHYHTDQITQK